MSERHSASTEPADLDAVARAIVDDNQYMTIATVDQDGAPWATPVWFAHEGYAEFFWVSHPDAGHSQNVHVRSEVAVVIFDSRVPVGTGRGVYLAATASQVPGDELDRGIGIFARRSVERGAKPWTRENVLAPAPHRLYRAVVTAAFVNDDRDRRTRVTLTAPSA
jgi:uncharacterized protein YhbP (UPF0306 family)